MENKQSGLVTPPIVSPRPIQTQKPHSADESWKIVGSPPSRPLLSPPEEKEKNRVFQDSDITTVEGNRARAINSTLSATDLLDLTDSTISSFSLGAGTGNESSSASSASSPTTPQHIQAPHRMPYINTSGGHHRTVGFTDDTRASVFALDPTLGKSTATPQPAAHFKSASTGALGSGHLETRSFHSSMMNNSSYALAAGVKSSTAKETSLLSQETDGHGRGAGVIRGGMKQHSVNGPEPSLSVSSFIWNGRASNDASNNSDSSSKLAVSLGALSTSKEEDNSSTTFGMRYNPPSSRSAADAIGTGVSRTGRSLSFSEPSFSNAFGLSSATSGFDQEDDDVLRYRPPLPTMDEEAEYAMEPRASRMRSFSTSAALNAGLFSSELSSSVFGNAGAQDPFIIPSDLAAENENRQLLNHKQSLDSHSAWPSATGDDAISSNHRRSVTSTSGYGAPIWEPSGLFQPLPLADERKLQADRQRNARRFSVAPSSGFHTYDAFLDDVDAGNSSAINSFNRHAMDNELVQQAQRRHSVAGSNGSYLRSNATPFTLASSLESMHLEDGNQANKWSLNEDLREVEEEEGEYQTSGSNTAELGKGLSLGQLPHRGSLYVVEFKAGRNDLFYVTENSGLSLKVDDLVIVEADRGKDLGKVVNDSITPRQIQELQAHQAEMAALQSHQDGSSGGGHRVPKEIHPKRIFRLAQQTEIAQLVSKNQDELKAMMVCQTKVRQKRLPMEVVDAEYQWDRRKLTFYFVADRRIDFRELVRDLFKIYKTRIWMYAVNSSMAQTGGVGPQSNSPPPSATHQAPQQRHYQGQSHHHHQGHQSNYRQGSTMTSTSPSSSQRSHNRLQQPSDMRPMSPVNYYSQYYQTQISQYGSYPQYPQVPIHHLQQPHPQPQLPAQLHQLQPQQYATNHHRSSPKPFYPQQK
ncbi:hypothetical protein BGZ50_009691 [Haplosporangium sp. Z 11]|nr:hypothetical protein BGZ50_009691 [Haplosporangium sp. Z 11]